MRKIIILMSLCFFSISFMGCGKPELAQPKVKGSEKSLSDGGVADAEVIEPYVPIKIHVDMSKADMIKVIKDLSERLKTAEENMICFHKNCCSACACGK